MSLRADIERRTGEPPFFITGGQDAHILDENGERYLDLTSGWNVVNAGWNNEEISRAWMTAASRLSFRPSWCREAHYERLQELWSEFAPGYALVPSCSGGEAVDNALKVARLVTGRPGAICFSGAYHGSTSGAAFATGYHVPHLEPLGLEGVTATLPIPATGAALAEAERVIRAFEPAGSIIFETVLTNLGCRVVPDAFLALLVDLSRELGLVLICDEVGTGINRTGSLLSGFGRGLRPDIIVCGKALTNGLYPLSLCLVRADLARDIDEPSFASTFAGSPSGSAAALATLQWHRERELGAVAVEVGAQLRRRLEENTSGLSGVTGVHGQGLELALHLDWSRLRAARLSPYGLVQRLRKRSLFATLSPGDQHLMITPPLTAEYAELLAAADLIADALDV